MIFLIFRFDLKELLINGKIMVDMESNSSEGTNASIEKLDGKL